MPKIKHKDKIAVKKNSLPLPIELMKKELRKMSENKFNTVRVKHLYILENEARVRNHDLYHLSDRNENLAAIICRPLIMLTGGVTGYLLSMAIVERVFADTLLFTLFGLLIGYLSGCILGFILHAILNANRMDTEQHEAFTMTRTFAYSVILNQELNTLSTPYISEDNAVSFGYEYIDLKESTSDILVLNIPAELKSAGEVKENDPAMREALDIYVKENAPSEDTLLKVVSGILPTIRHRESQLTEQLTQAFYKQSAPNDLLINQLKQESQKLQSEIESLESSLGTHVKENQSIIERTR